MKTLLIVKSSIFGDHGQSAELASQFVELWRQKHSGGRVVSRDLVATPLPHLDAARFAALGSDPAARTAEQAAVVAESDVLVAELQAADEILLAVPMYNFAVPSQLKAWFDHITRAGVTFKYTAAGAVGLLGDKPVTIIATRGGFYAGTATDSQTPWLQTILGFVGLTRVNFIYAEGIAISAEHKARARESALSGIKALFR
jgi:FMN-dependent NADH-azoreductase